MDKYQLFYVNNNIYVFSLDISKNKYEFLRSTEPFCLQIQQSWYRHIVESGYEFLIC